MTYEEVKNLLRSVRGKKSRLSALQSYIIEERALMQSVSAMQYQTDVGVVSSTQNNVETRYAKHLDRIKKWQTIYDKLFDEMCEEEDRLAEMMKRLTPEEYEVILNRYLKGVSRRKTADLMGFTEDGLKTITRRALKKMSKT